MDIGTAKQTPEEQIFEVKKGDLLTRVMPLVNGAAATGASITQAFPRPLAFNLFGQGVAYFESAQLLIMDGRPVEALASLHGLATIAARFEQMTSHPQALGLIVRLAVDAFAAELSIVHADRIRASMDELLISAAETGIQVPATVPSADGSAIWQSLSAEMLFAERAINGSYLITSFHVKPGADSADFHTKIESSSFTDLVASAAVIAQLNLLQNAATLFGWTLDSSMLDDLLAEARQLNEAAARQ